MFTLSDLSVFTGLTDRTLRNYLKTGLLRGDKSDGTWRFTQEQAVEFMQHPTIKPIIKTKHHAPLFDFVADDKKNENALCIVLDLAGADLMAKARFLCEAVNDRPGVRFSFSKEQNRARIILIGKEDAVARILFAYYAEKP